MKGFRTAATGPLSPLGAEPDWNGQPGRKKEFDFSINGLLLNPLNGKDHEEMEGLIADFMDFSQVEEEWTQVVRKGAFLAQDELAFQKERPDELALKPEEEDALRVERDHKWSQPFILYALVGCCSMGAAVQGWDESAINQAQIVPSYLTTLNVGGSAEHPSVLLGLLNSAPYLSCALIGCWLSDPLNKFLGRRWTIFVTCFIASITCLAQGLVSSWQGLFVARFLLGLGMGPKSSTVPVYAAEAAPYRIRGALVMMWQMWTAFGIMLGYVVGPIFQNIQGDLRWRLIIGSPMVLPIFVMAYVLLLPESPRWLIEKGRTAKTQTKRTARFREAFSALRKLRGNRLLGARDLFLIYHTLIEEQKIREARPRVIEMFTVPRNRRALRAGSIVMFFQQFCGVNVLAYFSSLVFVSAGFDVEKAGLYSMGFGIINFVFATPAVKLIDTFGRRNLLLFTFPLMSIFQLFTGLAFLAKGGTRKALVVIGMYLFSAAYSPGEGPVPFTYCSECMPLYVRDLAMSLFTAILWFFNFLLCITFPSFIRSFDTIGTFCYYAAWCMVGWFAVLFFVPETGGQTLESLDARFSIPTKEFMAFSVKQIRYAVFHGVLRRRMKKPKLDPSDVATLPAREMRHEPRGPRQIPLDHDIERLATVTTHNF